MKILQITPTILILSKNHLTIVTSLDNMVRIIRQYNSPYPRHTSPPVTNGGFYSRKLQAINKSVPFSI